MTEIVNHKLLGKIEGVAAPGAIKFLGIKYASLKNRFSPAQLLHGPQKEGVLDATKFGPTVITAPEACELDMSFIQQTLPYDHLVVSDLDGLNLNVVIPRANHGSIDTEAALPVFIYIHGGGFAIGSSAWPQLDLARFVEFSAKIGSPVIGVSINYRLGAPGFLTSSELRAEGYQANNGLRDQRTAIQWVKENIEGFGGNSDSITVIGQSAGGASVTFHLYSQHALFNKAMCIGGTHLMMPPVPTGVQEHVYQSVLQTLGLESLPAKERIQALIELPPEEMYTKFGFGLPLFPAADDDLLPSVETYAGIAENGASAQERMPGKSWCGPLMIGDAQFDGNVFHAILPPNLKSGAGKSFCESVRQSLRGHPSEADALLKVYNVTPELADNEAFSAIAHFGTDICFHAATTQLARGYSGKAFVYHFNMPNPWEGPWKGVPGHIFDVAVLFMNYHDRLSAEDRDISEKYATHVIEFIAGIEPYPRFSSDGGAMVYGPPGKGADFITGNDLNKLGRRADLVPIAEQVGYDALFQAWMAFTTSK